MNILEKILEEIEKEAVKMSTQKSPHQYYKAVGTRKIEEIICSNMDEAKDTDVPGNNGWIPVEERLPEEKGWYQCTCSDEDIWNEDIVIYLPEFIRCGFISRESKKNTLQSKLKIKRINSKKENKNYGNYM